MVQPHSPSYRSQGGLGNRPPVSKLERDSVDSRKLEYGCRDLLIGDIGPYKGHIRLYWNVEVG